MSGRELAGEGSSRGMKDISIQEKRKNIAVGEGSYFAREKQTSFGDLGVIKELQEACKEKCGWQNPTKMQASLIPSLLRASASENDVCVIGYQQNEYVKMGVYAIPVLQALIESHMQPFFACVISPSRELGVQVVEEFQTLGAYIGLQCADLAGRAGMGHEAISLAKRPHVIVATPHRLLNHLSDTRGFSLGKLKYLVLDGADRLHIEDYKKLTDGILHVIPHQRRIYLFSATWTKQVSSLEESFLTKPQKIDRVSMISQEDRSLQQLCVVKGDLKDCYLAHILFEKFDDIKMIFTRTDNSAYALAAFLQNLDLRAISIIGHMDKSARQQALEKFKNGEYDILVCADGVTRGLAIPLVDLVISYDVPCTRQQYMDRVPFAQRSGAAIVLVSTYEMGGILQQLENYTGIKFSKFPTKYDRVLSILEKVKEARRKSRMNIKQMKQRP